MMELWEGIGGEKTGPKPTARLSCLPGSPHTSPSGIQPIPHKNLCPQTHHWTGGCQQAPAGGWLPNSPGTGVRRETEASTMPGRGGDDECHQGTTGTSPEVGARCWRLGLSHTSCTRASSVRCAGWTECACRSHKQTHVLCVLLLLHETLLAENLSF